MELNKIIIIWLIILNISGLFMVSYDKSKAKSRGWRVPERRFFVIGLLGGALGVYGGMYLFRHKTKHPKFVYGIPLLLILNIVILYFIAAK